VKAKTSMVEYFKKSRKRKFKRDIMSTKFKSPVYNVIAVPMDKIEANDYNLIMWPKEKWIYCIKASNAMVTPCQLFVL
jgi:hypothetical protein